MGLLQLHQRALPRNDGDVGESIATPQGGGFASTTNSTFS